MAKPFQLLVFDWDGTLMDSEARIVGSFQAGIRETGLPPRADADIRQIIGLGLQEAVRALYPEAGDAARAALIERYRYHYLSAAQAPTPLFEGARDTLRALDAAGYLLAVATGKSRAGLDRALGETGLDHLFVATRTADETRSKPHPQMLHEIMEELDMPAGHTLMIGDTDYDLHMAANAGASALAVSYGAHDLARLRACRPLACLDAIGELPGWLEQAARRAS